MAGPVPLDVDGDGAYDSLVLPARLTRSDVVREREAEGGEDDSSRRRGKRRRQRAEEEEDVARRERERRTNATAV